MKLLVCVELKTAPTFTARSTVKDRAHAEEVIKGMSIINKKVGYYKYSNPSLYSDDYIKICDLQM